MISREKGLTAWNSISKLTILNVLVINFIVELFEVAGPFIVFIVALHPQVTSSGVATTIIPQDAPAAVDLIIFFSKANALIPSIAFLFFLWLPTVVVQESLR